MSLESLHKFFSQISLNLSEGLLAFIYYFSSTSSLTFSLHVDFYKAKARLIVQLVSTGSRMGLLPRVM